MDDEGGRGGDRDRGSRGGGRGLTGVAVVAARVAQAVETVAVPVADKVVVRRNAVYPTQAVADAGRAAAVADQDKPMAQ